MLSLPSLPTPPSVVDMSAPSDLEGFGRGRSREYEVRRLRSGRGEAVAVGVREPEPVDPVSEFESQGLFEI